MRRMHAEGTTCDVWIDGFELRIAATYMQKHTTCISEAYTYINTYIYIYKYKFTCTYIYIYTYLHTNIYIYIPHLVAPAASNGCAH